MDETHPNYGKIMRYIEHNPAAVLSTIGDDGPFGAVVYVIVASYGKLGFATKTRTRKYANIVKHPEVSLTFFNETEGTTLQVTGKAFVADKADLKDYILDKMQKAHALMADWLPPITKINAGEYAIIGIELTYARLAEYQGLDISGPVFTELKKST